MKYHTTTKGTKLPITNLKGKDYMMVAYRIQWFREENPFGQILTEALTLAEKYAIFKATISVLDSQGGLKAIATATKKEDTAGFADFIEKAETGAIGRALAMAGYGTQFSVPELDEENRLADAPLVSSTQEVAPSTEEKPVRARTSSFRNKKVSPVVEAPSPSQPPPSVLTDESEGWQ